MAKYTLKPGYYRFKATERGWDLYRTTFTCSLDNSENDFAFHYVLDNESQTLAPGEIHDLSGDLPPIITFDDGRGVEKKVKLDKGTYRVAIGSDEALDIYAADAVSDSSAPKSFADATTAEPKSEETSNIGLASAKPKRTVTASLRPASRKAVRSLPSGFTLFDPVEALTDADKARRLPKQFTLFRSAAKGLAKN